eukprot:2098854-Lingulodinium_polyedra.AAC.1
MVDQCEKVKPVDAAQVVAKFKRRDADIYNDVLMGSGGKHRNPAEFARSLCIAGRLWCHSLSREQQ